MRQVCVLSIPNLKNKKYRSIACQKTIYTTTKANMNFLGLILFQVSFLKSHFHKGMYFIFPSSTLTSLSSFFVIKMPFLTLNFFMNSVMDFKSSDFIFSRYLISIGVLLCITSTSFPFFQKEAALILLMTKVSTILPKKSSSILDLYK